MVTDKIKEVLIDALHDAILLACNEAERNTAHLFGMIQQG